MESIALRRGVVLGRASLQDTGVEDRERRIVDTAMGLAQSGGFEAVRMRDVAAQSGCALATLYRHFPSKDELLLAALRREAQGLEQRMRRRAPEGGRAIDRLTAHFDAKGHVRLQAAVRRSPQNGFIRNSRLACYDPAEILRSVPMGLPCLPLPARISLLW